MLIGYARVSTDDQDLAFQRKVLAGEGCLKIYEEKVSGSSKNRPELVRLLEHLREGDVVVVYGLDRLARSTKDLLEVGEVLRDMNVGLRSLREPWADTTTPAGRMVLTVFAGIYEFERALINERTSAGRAYAKAKGVRFGRPLKMSPEQVVLARQLTKEGRPTSEVAKLLNVHRSTLYRILAGEDAAA
jgi:DNA invertase Pin-like site-specific DNA recombinase